MNTKTQIVMLPIEKLEHHPENPRKNIGDITELTESIKVDGILQNLTVVPKPDEADRYLIVIGNRRFEAAQGAGLQFLPCVISDMDHTKQLETMLIENINRSDLTPIEQAKGFEQLTLAGFSPEDIASKTGFSESTVRRRLKLTEYNEKKVIEAQDRGATLDDFVKLEKIKSKSERNKLLSIVGTNNFNIEFNRTLEAEQVKEFAKNIEKEVKKFAQPTPDNFRYWDSNWNCVYSNRSLKDFDIKKCLKACKNKTNLFYYLVITDWNNYCEIFEKVEVTSNNAPAKQEKSEAEKQYGRAKRYINKAAIDHYNLRLEFVKSLVNKSKIKDCEKICLDTLINDCDEYGYISGSCNDNKTYEKLGIYEGYFDKEKFISHKEQFPAGHMVAIVYAHLHDFDTLNCFESYYSSSKSNFYCDNKHLEKIYDFLEELGYGTSDEEKSILNGTHPIYDVDLGAEFLAELKRKK